MEQAERILFIDDDGPVRIAFSRSVRAHGFDVDLADGAESAVALMRDKVYSVIATDYRMPKVNGLDLIVEMRELQPDATYMLVSGECDLDLALEAVNDHAVSYVICKPWDMDELISVLRRSVEAYWERAGQRRVQQTMVARTRDLDSQKSRLEAALTEGENHLTEGLLNALQLRGHETKAHCQRVAAFAIRIAEEMNLKGRILSTIRQGALLHDVGTIGIPDAILLKKESLTPEEWQLMRMHPQIGGSLLEGFENLRGAHTLVMQHHERFDGSGYPMGLRGEQIFIGARIFAVADSLDAILTERSYSEPMALDLAIQRIVGQRGTLHDPKVVDAFAQIAPEEWQEIAARYPEDPKSVKDAA